MIYQIKTTKTNHMKKGITFKKYKENLTTQYIDGKSFLSSYNIIVAKIDMQNEIIIQYEEFPEKIQKHIDYAANAFGMPIVKKFSK